MKLATITKEKITNQPIIGESPGYLQDLIVDLLRNIEALVIFEKVLVGMLDRQIEANRLQQNLLHRKQKVLWVVAKGGEPSLRKELLRQC